MPSLWIDPTEPTPLDGVEPELNIYDYQNQGSKNNAKDRTDSFKVQIGIVL